MKKILLFLTTIIIAGCGDSIFVGMEDKNSTNAKNFDISGKLDSRDYDWLLKACKAGDASVSALDCAAAAMGYAGFDPANLLDALTSLTEGANKGDLSAILSILRNPDAVDDITFAINLLEKECPHPCADKDISTQVVMASVTRTVTAIGQAAQLGGTTVDVEDGISSDEATTIATAIASNPKVDTDGDGVGDTPFATVITEDVAGVLNYLPGSGIGGSETGDSVQSSTTQIDSDGDTKVSATEIQNYLTNVVAVSKPAK